MNEDIEDKEFESEDFEHALRPKGFEDFRGQDQIVDNLKVFIQAAQERQDALDHVLLHGPPGLGKTTLSYIIANKNNPMEIQEHIHTKLKSGTNIINNGYKNINMKFDMDPSNML